jgi:hypothetical protein
MFAECSNPDCRVPFDYREGRLIAFCKPPTDCQFRAGHHNVEHFWLCGDCSPLYLFKRERGTGMKIKPREKERRERTAPRLVATAPRWGWRKAIAANALVSQTSG